MVQQFAAELVAYALLKSSASQTLKKTVEITTKIF